MNALECLSYLQTRKENMKNDMKVRKCKIGKGKNKDIFYFISEIVKSRLFTGDGNLAGYSQVYIKLKSEQHFYESTNKNTLTVSIAHFIRILKRNLFL